MSFTRKKRRSRAVLLSSFGSFLLINLVFAVVIDTRWCSVRDPDYTFRAVRWQSSLQSSSAKTMLFLGSSRVSCGIDAETITHELKGQITAFNFAIPGSSFFKQRVYLERINEDHRLPDLVVIELMIPFLCGSKIPYEQKRIEGDQFSVQELSSISLAGNFRGCFRKWFYHRSLPIRKDAEGIRRKLHLDTLFPTPGLNQEDRTIDAYGWRPSDLPEDREQALRSLAHNTYDQHYSGFAICAEQEEKLDALLARCLNLKVKPILLIMPEGSGFRRLFDQDSERTLQDLLQTLKRKYGVAVIDTRSWMADNAFVDEHHMRSRAGKAFSQRLAQEALPPVLESLSSTMAANH